MTLRVVMLTADGAEHRFVTNTIHRRVPLTAVVVDHGRPNAGRLARVRTLWRRYGMVGNLRRLVYRGTEVLFGLRKRRVRATAQVLGPPAAAFDPDIGRIDIAGCNTPEGRAAIAALEPDVLAVYGTGIVGPKTLGLASVSTLNLHTGISPTYRGVDCSFWPLLDGRPDLVGATVHDCVAAVDGGDIYAVAPAELVADDTRDTVFARAVLVGARLYADVLDQMSHHPLVGMQQDPSAGREYRVKDQRVLDELRVRLAVRRGLIRDSVALRSSVEYPRSTPSGETEP